jgi:hypothetical protein
MLIAAPAAAQEQSFDLLQREFRILPVALLGDW